jgi:TRAP-type mannitol/chloroaromatic compound transport system substrate-binding protein
MRNSVIGLIVGTVIGIVFGATVIAPRLQRTAPGTSATAPEPAPAPADLAKQLPRALVPRPDVSMKMANSFPPDTPVAGELARRIDARIWDVSRGQFEVRSYPPGALAPVSDLYEAVGSGGIDAAFAPPPAGDQSSVALALFSGVPFGPDIEEFLAWMDFGGGRSLLDEINQENGVHGIICGLLPPSAFGWFREELQSPQQLRGLRIDASGLIRKVLARLGAEVVDLHAGELTVAIEQGTVDAVSWASPMLDKHMAFGTWLKNYYPQGWNQSLTPLELMINQKKWQSLNATQKAQIETVCGDNVRHSIAEGGAGQFKALQEMYAAGVHLRRLPPSVRDALERAWQQVVQQESNADAHFRRVWQSLSTFRANFAVWRELSRP